nr:tetratricopeptide repeat protein [uncultured Roseococcus sp.]
MNGQFLLDGLRRLRFGVEAWLQAEPEAAEMRPAPDSARVALVTPLIDAAYYWSRVAVRGPVPGDDAAAHYLTQGAALGVPPNPFFDDAFYRAQLLAPLPAAMTPLEHYLEHGAEAGLDPSPLFSTLGYLRVHTDVAGAKVNPLWHFLRWGAAEGRLPLPDDLPDLEERLTGALARDPDNAPALRILGEIRLRQQRPDEALDAFERAEALHPWDDINARSRLLHARASRAMSRGRFSDGIDLYRQILSLAPDNSYIKHVIAQLLHRDGRLDEAEVGLAEVAAQAGEASPAAREHQFLAAESQLVSEFEVAARVAVAAGDQAAALQLVTQAEVLRPDVRARVPGLHVAVKGAHAQGLLLLDNSFPSQGSSFRYGEFSAYLEAIPESRIYSSTYHLSVLATREPFLDEVRRYADASGVSLERIQAFHAGRDFACKVAYCVFLNGATTFFYRPELHAERLAFTLYPGGGFAFNEAASDEKLRRLCDDRRLSKIITTQVPTYNYLVERGFCTPDRLLNIFGVIVPAGFDPGLTESFAAAPRGLDGRLHICFVAHRYSPTGIEKGYDVFAALVRAMKERADMQFHVVGRFDPDTLDLGGARNITFHGILAAPAFPAFYAGMDIIVSPNISDARLNGGKGSFDGFPTTTCVEAGLHGVAMFPADLEGMNIDLERRAIFISGEEMEIIDRNPERLIALVERYATDRDALRRMAMRGRQALLREYSHEKQVVPRVALLRAQLQG